MTTGLLPVAADETAVDALDDCVEAAGVLLAAACCETVLDAAGVVVVAADFVFAADVAAVGADAVDPDDATAVPVLWP